MIKVVWELSTYFCLDVAVIIGVSKWRKEKLKDLRVENVIDEGQVFRGLLPCTNTKIAREFFVTFWD